MDSTLFFTRQKKYGMVENPHEPYDPEQFQTDIHDSTATYNALLGSPGLGKTILGAQETARFIRVGQGNGLILMPTYKMAYDVALRELRKWIAKSIFIPRSYQNSTIELPGGRTIFIRSADHPEGIDGVNMISFIWIDEGDLISSDVWDRTKERLLRQRPGITDRDRVIVTATPQLVGGKSWLRDTFYAKHIEGNANYYCRRATIWESRRIPEALKTEIALEAPPGTWARARYDAEWAIIAEGLIYPELPKLGMNSWNLSESDEFILGVDCGYRDPFVAILLGRKGGGWCAFAESRCSGMAEGEIARQIDAMLARAGIPIGFLITAYHDHDPNQIANISARVRSQIHWLTAAKDDRDASIGYVRDLMILNRLHFASGLHTLYNEFAGYKWKQTGTKQDPEHTYSHGPDAIRYGLWTHALNPLRETKFIYERI